MKSNAASPDEYIASLPEERKTAIAGIRKAINKNIPKGFKEQMCYGMLGWVVPHELYPPGYHCDPAKPLMLMSLGSTKGHIALHHLGLYGSGSLLEWFKEAWAAATPKKLDMGKGCVRFKKPDEIPFELIGELASKLTPQQWVAAYENAFRR